MSEANATCFNNGTWNGYEKFAANQHGYAVHIIRNFHMAAILHALLNRDNTVAQNLMMGLDDRVKKDFDPKFTVNAKDDGAWPGEQAVFLLQAASLGFPLTSAEVAIVQKRYETALTAMASFTFLNPWDASVADGEYTSANYMPSTGDSGISVDEIGIAFEYCNSPFKNPAGKAPVDCDIIKDPSKW